MNDLPVDMQFNEVSTGESDRSDSPVESDRLPVRILSPVLPHARHIVLTGFMGAGKSAVGALLADQLGWTFLDLDRLIEDRAQDTIAALFSKHGEADFRRLESTALAAALGRDANVIALGGGAPESLTNRLLLEQTPGTIVVFLDAPFVLLAQRCGTQSLLPGAAIRPLFADPYAAHARFEQRHPLYRKLAHLTIDTSAQTPQATASCLLEQLSPIKR